MPPIGKSSMLTLSSEINADREAHEAVARQLVTYDDQLLVGLELGPTPKRPLHLVEDSDSLIRRHRNRGGDDPAGKCGSNQ
jgi:hypothetical protein